MSTRPTYTHGQISAYFERIRLPQRHRKYGIEGMEPAEALDFLHALQKHHIVEIPFENLTLHYSHHRQISIHPEQLFQKVVGDNNGRGGYCMENNCLFGTLLHSLGFTIYSTGARVNNGIRWTGWSHMVNLVTIGGRKYHVDVGFGGNAPIVPMELDKSGPTQPHISPASARLQWRNIEANTDQNQRLWVYEHRINESSEFQTMYCFTELELLPNDYQLMNYFTSTNPRTWFVQEIAGVKQILGSDGESLVGSLILGNRHIKWRINGKTEKVIEFDSEDGRVQAIEEYFGIKLGSVERDSIRGLTSELK